MSISRLSLLAGGLGHLRLRQISPSVATAFTDLGLLAKTSIAYEVSEEEHHDERGRLIDVIEGNEKFALDSTMMQSRKADMDAIMGHDGTRRFAAQYYGLSRDVFQYYLLPNVHVSRSNGLIYEPKARTLRVLGRALDDTTLVIPSWSWPYLLLEAAAEIRIADLELWVAPQLNANDGTTSLFDLAGFARHGTINPSGDVATIWAADGTLLLDGSDDYVSFGDVCDIGATDDFLIELWVRFPALGAIEEVASKKSTTGSDAGWYVRKLANNNIEVKIADGTDTVTLEGDTAIDSTSAVYHVAIVGNRSGVLDVYLNGASIGQEAMTDVGDMGNAINLYLGRIATGYGNVKLAGFRLYKFPSETLPSDIGTIVDRHYAAGVGT